MTTRRTILFALAALLPAAALAQGPVTLARMAKAGQTHRYKLQIDGTVGGAEFVLKSVAKTTVKEVTPAGEIVSEDSQEEQVLQVGGMEIPLPEAAPVTLKRDASGRLVSLMQNGGVSLFGPAVEKALAMISGPVFPGRPVQPNESWTVEDENPVIAGTKIKIEGTYQGLEKVGEQELWKMKQVATVPTGDTGDAKLTFTFWLSPSTGEMVRHESEGLNIPTQFGPMSYKESMVLTPEAPAA